MDYTFIASVFLMVFGFSMWIIDLYRRLDESEKDNREIANTLNKERFENGEENSKLMEKILRYENSENLLNYIGKIAYPKYINCEKPSIIFKIDKVSVDSKGKIYVYGCGTVELLDDVFVRDEEGVKVCLQNK